MGWLANAALREARLIKQMLKLASYSTDGSGNITGFVDASGNPVVPIDKTLTEFLALTSSDVADGAVVHITNLHGTSGAGGVYATWDAVAAKWGQNFGASWVFADYDSLVASFPLVSKWDGFKFWVNTGVGLGGAELIHKTTRYRHTQKGRVLMALNNTRDTISTSKNTEKIECQWQAPTNFLRAADSIQADSHVSKSGTTNFLARDFHIGTAGTAADQSLMGALAITGSATNIGCDEDLKQWVITDETHVQRPQPVGSVNSPGFNGVARDVSIAIPDISTNSVYFSAGYWLSGGTSDTVTFERCAIYLEMGS